MAILRTCKFYLRSLLKDPYYWFWAVFFMLFWLVMGAFVFGSTMTKDSLREELASHIPSSMPGFESILEDAWSKTTFYYTAGWYSGIALYSLASIAIGLVYYVYYSTIPIRYLTKYSRASPTRFYAGLTLAAVTVSLVAAGILIASTIVVYSYRFHELSKLILPKNLLGVFATTAVGGVFTFFFSTTLALLVVVLRKPKLLGMISFVPFLLSYALGMAGIYVGSGLLHLSPFNLIMLLTYHYYSGTSIALDLPATMMWRTDPELSSWLGTTTHQTVDPLTLWLILTAWILVFVGTALALLRVQKGVSVEEIIS
jgi:multisubunit Na+/H+ antiporter MnhC subunit